MSRTIASGSFSTRVLFFAFTATISTASAAATMPGSVSLQVFGGARSATPADVEKAEEGEWQESEKFSGGEFGGSVLVQPVPLVPASIGGYVVQQNFKGNTDDFEDRLEGYSAGLLVMGWLDLGLVQPFVKGGYDLFSRHRRSMEFSDIEGTPRLEYNGKMTGYRAALGFRFKPLPMIGAFVQAEFADQKFQPNDVTVHGGELDSRTYAGFRLSEEEQDATDKKIRSQAILVGIDLGG